MAIKTFNIEEAVYSRFSDFCKNKGMSMSKQVEFFMRSIIEEEPEARKEYLERLNQIRGEAAIKIGTLENLKKRFV
jgi:antitoxin component of RelBE/YafQ-DinJ toxin-antitoxin module